jgi:sodium transport system permease protein
MLRQAVVIARKEVSDHLRDIRSVVSSLLYLLMGPLIVLLVSYSMKGGSAAKSGAILSSMAALFTLIATFTGGMNVAMDSLAGERERRSLVPLLLNPVTRLTVIVGKAAATCIFAIAGLAITLLGFFVVFSAESLPTPLFRGPSTLGWAIVVLLPLAAFTAALQTAVSTLCRTPKEAHTYLSLLMFVPMGIGMYLLFMQPTPGSWLLFVPIAGQQSLIQQTIANGQCGLPEAATVALASLWFAGMILFAAGRILNRDEIVYGN